MLDATYPMFLAEHNGFDIELRLLYKNCKNAIVIPNARKTDQTSTDRQKL